MTLCRRHLGAANFGAALAPSGAADDPAWLPACPLCGQLGGERVEVRPVAAGVAGTGTGGWVRSAATPQRDSEMTFRW